MNQALAVDSRRIALELHALLRDIDPARWRDELEGVVRARLDTIRQRLIQLVESWPDDSVRALRARLVELVQVIRDHMPAPDAPVYARRAAWMRLRAELQPAYEALAASLRSWSIHVPSLRPTNYTRNVFHVLCAVGVILLVEYVLVTPGRMLLVACLGAAAAWTMEISRRFSGPVNRLLMRIFAPVAHPHEAHRVNSATWYTTALVLLAAFFSPMVGVAALAVLGLGDPIAAIVGRRWGRVRLVNGRSLEGTLAFFAAGTLAALLTLRLWHGALPWPSAVAVAAGAAAFGAVAELVARRIDDNLAIPLASAVGGAAILGVLG